MACEWEDVAKELAWAAFKRKLKERVLKKLAGRAAAGLVAAAIDGPFPVGDVIGILMTIWGLGEAGVGFYEAYSAWEFIERDVLKRTKHLLDELADPQRFGPAFLDDDCSCNCLKDYLRSLIRARSAARSRFKRAVHHETKKLISCVRDCQRPLSSPGRSELHQESQCEFREQT